VKNIIVAITGASGVIIGIRLLEELNKAKCKVHLILSNWAKKNIAIETEYSINYIQDIAYEFYDIDAIEAPVASGSYLIDGMIIAPCSMKTMSAIANGYSDNLITRAADVSIKESRKLIIAPRETPISQIHLKNMLELSKMGVVLFPPMIGFYYKPKTIDDIINHIIGKILDNLKIKNDLFTRWK
jgi:flavin prenyltransferase